ncbi:MAG: DoxX family protein [Blastocatellia bacterium]
MDTTENTASASKTLFWIGWVLSIISALMLIMSGSMKLIQPASMAADTAKGLEHIGWRVDQLTGLGILELACTIIYLIPKTAVLGAILLAAYLGGAVATHVRVGDAFFVQVLIGVVVWLGLWLRDPRLRELLPLRS